MLPIVFLRNMIWTWSFLPDVYQATVGETPQKVMSILNLGLQNCSLERESSGDELEKKLRSCSSMQAVRDAAVKQPELKDAWVESIEQCGQHSEIAFSA